MQLRHGYRSVARKFEERGEDHARDPSSSGSQVLKAFKIGKDVKWCIVHCVMGAASRKKRGEEVWIDSSVDATMVRGNGSALSFSGLEMAFSSSAARLITAVTGFLTVRRVLRRRRMRPMLRVRRVACGASGRRVRRRGLITSRTRRQRWVRLVGRNTAPAVVAHRG
jgi:hypothetical protein